jgi:hypothetical protein
MKTLFSPFVFAFFLMIAVASGTDESTPLPHYPDQPNINVALKKLTEAQKLVTGGGSKTDAAARLKEAQAALNMAIKNKGSFPRTASRLTGQAIKHLEKGDTATATHEIAEAIEATNKAGKAGAD